MLAAGLTATVGVMVSTGPARGTVPGSIEVSCDVNRTAFRKAALGQSEVIFRLWDAQRAGNQCRSDYHVPESAVARRNSGRKS